MKPLQVYTLTLRKVHATMLARGFSAQQLLAKETLSDTELKALVVPAAG